MVTMASAITAKVDNQGTVHVNVLKKKWVNDTVLSLYNTEDNGNNGQCYQTKELSMLMC